jgi:hypothetical protein
MFTHLAKFRTIFVTGPQRSGTTIAGRIIAQDLDREYIDERDYGVHELANLFRLVEEKAVIQGPALSAYCHLLPKHVAVVFMRRPLKEIVSSQDRTILSTGNPWTQAEEPVELRKYFREEGPIAAVKYEVWERYQKPHMDLQGKTYLELEYATLAEHPLWVPKDGRQGWHAKQTSNDPLQKRKKKRI